MYGFQLTRDGAPARKALDKIRCEITKTHKLIRDTTSAEIPLDEVKIRLRAAIDAAMYNLTPELPFEEFAQDGAIAGRPAMLPVDLRLSDLAYLLGPEKIVDLIADRLAARGSEAGLPAVQRADRLTELRKELDKLERAEEVEILQLEAAGHTILRREDARPDLLFDIWGKLT